MTNKQNVKFIQQSWKLFEKSFVGLNIKCKMKQKIILFDSQIIK